MSFWLGFLWQVGCTNETSDTNLKLCPWSLRWSIECSLWQYHMHDLLGRSANLAVHCVYVIVQLRDAFQASSCHSSRWCLLVSNFTRVWLPANLECFLSRQVVKIAYPVWHGSRHICEKRPRHAVTEVWKQQQKVQWQKDPTLLSPFHVWENGSLCSSVIILLP